jgi:hypothetical protein
MQHDDRSAPVEGDLPPDREERIQDFLARHGGAGPTPMQQKKTPAGDAGWYEVHAADGYRLHCDWSRVGSREEFQFSELAPRGRAGGPG